MKKFTMLATAAAVAFSASAFAADYKHDYKTTKEVKTEVMAVEAPAANTFSEGFYVVAGAGMSKVKNNFGDLKGFTDVKKNRSTLMAGVGYQFSSNVRADLTFDHTAKTDAKGDTKYIIKSGKNRYFNPTLASKIQSIMANAYYHFDDMASVSPYVTGGIGYAREKLTVAGVDSTDKRISESKSLHHLAYQVGFGVSKKMTDNISFDLGYKYFSTKSHKVKSVGLTSKPKAHKVLASVRYSF